ncbi:hypothetical protein [Streptomyces cyaneofuscatus]|uniref:hypothetical protein n=1 Tax=Streptomyces cyaneofuscatus TaxID=66883 RepID=UPI00341A2D8F
MQDLKIDAVEQEHGAQARASTSVKGSGQVSPSAARTEEKTYVSVQFQVIEENFVGHGHT